MSTLFWALLSPGEIAYPPFLHGAKQVLPRRKVFFQLILYGEFPSLVSIFP